MITPVLVFIVNCNKFLLIMNILFYIFVYNYHTRIFKQIQITPALTNEINFYQLKSLKKNS